MTADDPLQPRWRPGGVRVEAEAVTWESTVFAISIGVSVRYLEVPAEQVMVFLAAVDAGQLDEELAGIAGTPTGTTKDRPGRIRGIVAFDRVLRGALSRAERDPATGQLAEPGSRQHKRQRDDEPATRIDPGSTPSSSAPARAAVSMSTGAGVAAVASRSWWSSPVVAVGAVVAVVVVVAGTVFALTRPSDESAAAAVALSSSALSSTALSSTALSSTALSSPALTESAAAATASPSDGPTAPITTTAAGAPGSNNQFAGTWAFTRTVTENSGNADFPIGTTEAGNVTLTAACDEPTCAVDAERFGVATISGDQVAFAGTGAGSCPENPGITVELAYTITLTAAAPAPVDGVPRVGAMQGVGTLTVSDAAGCPAEIQPITYSYDLTRSG